MHPLSHLHLNNLVAPSLELLAESQMVVAMRLAGMAGLWPVETDEPQRMMSEKAPALMGAAHDAQSAASPVCASTRSCSRPSRRSPGRRATTACASPRQG